MKLGRNDPCWCGSGQKFKKCHGLTPENNPLYNRSVQILQDEDMPAMRRVCRLNAEILREVSSRVRPGISTGQINDWVHDMTLDAGGYPAPLNYPKGMTDPRNPILAPGSFPKSVCTSVNEVVCHGIPSPLVILKDGDIVNIDVTTYLDGFFGDCSQTVYVGEPGPEARRVTETALECLETGIAAVKPGGQLIAVGEAISRLAEGRGMSVVRDFTGHGIGRVFHAEPQVCHFPNRVNNCTLVPGMTFTIEPMINLGTWRTVIDPRDRWTAYTADRRLSAQFEHTIRVTKQGVEVLTRL